MRLFGILAARPVGRRGFVEFKLGFPAAWIIGMDLPWQPFLDFLKNLTRQMQGLVRLRFLHFLDVTRIAEFPGIFR